MIMPALNTSELNHIDSMVERLWANFDKEKNVENVTNGLNGLNGLSSIFNMSNRTQNLVTLYFDMSPEDRCYLNFNNKQKLESILKEKACVMEISTFLQEMIENNRVHITGDSVNIYEAYNAISRLLPITICFDLHLSSSEHSSKLDGNAEPINNIQKTYEIAICLVPQFTASKKQTIHVYVRGVRGKIEKLQQSVIALKEYFENNNIGTFSSGLQTKVDVPLNRMEVVGRSYGNLEGIGHKTSTTITPVRAQQTGMSNIYIEGNSFASIIYARSEICDRFVVELNFAINASQVSSIDPKKMEVLSEEYQVHILMKPSLLSDSNKVIVIRGTEKEVFKLFEVHKKIIEMFRNY